MPITFPLNDILTAQEQTVLGNLLGARTPAELEVAVTNLSKAAMREFADMILNRYTVRPTSEVNEVKLLHLVKHYFGAKIPSELEISTIFRIPERSATTLLRNLSVRHAETLATAYKDTIQAIFDAKVANQDGAHHVTIVSGHLREWLGIECSRVAPTFGSIYKVRSTNDRYAIPIDTYNAICAHLGLRP